MKNKIIEILGWYGMVAIVGAYFLTSFLIIGPTSLSYQILNFTGAIGIIIVSLRKKAYQSAVLNTFWAIIALVAILSFLR